MLSMGVVFASVQAFDIRHTTDRGFIILGNSVVRAVWLFIGVLDGNIDFLGGHAQVFAKLCEESARIDAVCGAEALCNKVAFSLGIEDIAYIVLEGRD